MCCIALNLYCLSTGRYTGHREEILKYFGMCSPNWEDSAVTVNGLFPLEKHQLDAKGNPW